MPEYRIRFGDKRTLSKGKIRLFSYGNWYSSNPQQEEKKILFQGMTKSGDKPGHFKGLEGDFNRISLEWSLEDRPVRIITHFDLYMNCSIIAQEPVIGLEPLH